MKKIDEEQFIEAVFEGIREWLHTDTSDYGNFVGIRDMARYMWRSLDKRQRHQKRKLSLKTAFQLKQERENKLKVEVERVNKRYRHLFWKFYIK